jgi:hypothetical protein
MLLRESTQLFGYCVHILQLLPYSTFNDVQFYKTNTAVSGNQQVVNLPASASVNPYVGKIN